VIFPQKTKVEFFWGKMAHIVRKNIAYMMKSPHISCYYSIVDVLRKFGDMGFNKVGTFHSQPIFYPLHKIGN
jgi:hypothetical protein